MASLPGQPHDGPGGAGGHAAHEVGRVRRGLRARGLGGEARKALVARWLRELRLAGKTRAKTDVAPAYRGHFEAIGFRAATFQNGVVVRMSAELRALARCRARRPARGAPALGTRAATARGSAAHRRDARAIGATPLDLRHARPRPLEPGVPPKRSSGL